VDVVGFGVDIYLKTTSLYLKCKNQNVKFAFFNASTLNSPIVGIDGCLISCSCFALNVTSPLRFRGTRPFHPGFLSKLSASLVSIVNHRDI